MNERFTCFVVGIGPHMIQCAERLLQRGHRICGMISTERRIANWASEHNIPCAEGDSNLGAFLKRCPFDYLFSIVWPIVIQEEVLALPRKGAINFHDGPLPRYAGVNATSWALIHQEKTHGVTWHLMGTKVDAGDMLKQRIVAVREDDTSFSLNVRCYEAALESFVELVDELSGGQAKPRRQDLRERTYFGKHKRPAAACVLQWDQPARKIAALVRALDFGSYVNPLGMAKLLLGEEVFLVPEVSVVVGDSSLAPGTIAAIEEDRMLVSTAADRIALRRLLTFEGQSVGVADVVDRIGIRNGDPLPGLNTRTIERLSTFDEAVARHESFWVRRLAKPRPVALPFPNRSGADGRAASYATMRAPLPPEVVASLDAGLHGACASEVLSAAFAAYLARINDNYAFDVDFGHPVLRSGIAGLPSLFAVQVPLRIELDPTAGFGAVLQRVREELALTERSLTYARDVIMRYPELRSLKAHGGRPPAQIAIQRIAASEGLPSPSCLLTLCVSEDAKEVRWIYDRTALDEELIDGMQRQWLLFLESAVANCTRPLTEIPLLDGVQRHEFLVQWNDTQVDYPQDRLIHQWFETQARRDPKAVAVSYEAEQLSYRELNQRANQVACWLQSQGVGPDVPVGVALERSLDMVVALLGILKAGGAYLPLDTVYPAERLAYMAQEAGVPIVLTKAGLLDRLPRFDGQVLCLDTDWHDSIAHQSPENPPSGAAPENLAYIIYTSGSTGKPKGVMNTHAGILNRLLWMQDQYHLTASDRVLQKTPFSFDVSVWEFFWPLMFGATLVVARPEGHKDNHYLVKTIVERQVTVMHFVPSMLQLFLQTPNVNDCRSLRHVICSGEALSVDLQDRFFARLDARLHNLYGPTEAAVDVTAWECRRENKSDIVPIGRPIANTQIYILDRFMQPVPVGIPGGLYIGGVQVARGYLNRPELTAERFVPDPFSDDSGARLYKTGDLARYRPDGNIEYLGRLDNQVKLQGFRIELGEIESLLNAHSAIRAAAVVVQGDTAVDKRLVAYLVPKARAPLSDHSLREYLRKRLPDHMVPAVFVWLEALPLTPNGKLDRRSLPAPAPQRTSQEPYRAPSNELEQVITGIWRDVLKVTKVGIEDNFFDLGGNSFSSILVVSRMRETLGVDVPITRLFQYPTVASLAQCLRLGSATGASLRISEDRAKRRRMALSRKRHPITAESLSASERNPS